ncbi:ABC transporter ATP-binding protein [Aminobacter sp. AP02]|uniref:ABC transporter ATP-binding protein n=1 Tax=Aminobacter sp. AP02 TaxID=2135737 RepID=UPI000D6D69A4|nr:ABC transporter ATP-binding protein [Aminobacter sp. AP02]PWK76786.1 amino acid/amide ABC transporter ATP-binding protein 1 (HAAT family) [Aminobacter sp. AP02]
MTTLLQVSGLTKRFGGLTAVREAGFTVAAGEVTGLLGPNGSGKTTMMNLISGNLKPDAGTVRLVGKDITGRRPHLIARGGIARTFQLVRVINDMTARENVVAGLAFRDRPLWGQAAANEADRLLERVGLGGRAEAQAAELTYVDQKRLELARALALSPRLLLLDEWLAGLNASELDGGIALIRSLSQEGVTVLMVEHVMSAIRQLCERCVVMNAGAIVAEGETTAVMSDPAVIAAYLGEEDD